MGEASGCLLRSFSQPSSTSCEFKEGDPLRALTSSISFGRFMTEPLAWEKWSSFSHNRTLEEVQKFSKPGSVAEKKAYFEAHYKRIAAKKSVASIEQESESPNYSPEPNVTNNIRSNSSMDLEVGELHKKENEVHNHSPEPNASDFEKSNIHSAVDLTQENESPRPSTELVGNGNNVEENVLGTTQVELAEASTEQVAFSENHIQDGFSNQLENVEKNSNILSVVNKKQGNETSRPGTGVEGSAARVELVEASTEQVVCSENHTRVEFLDQLENVEKCSKIMSEQEEMTYITDAANQRVKVPSSKMKPAISSSTSSSNNGVSKLRIAPVHPRNEENATSNRRKATRDIIMEKKRPAPQSLHISINFASPAAGKSHSMSSPFRQKVENTRTAKASANTPKDKLTQKAPTRVSKNSLVLPQLENRRSRTLLDSTVLVSRSIAGKLPSLSMNHSESSSACAIKTRSPTVPSSFSFRSEERAAKRKEFFQKLEEKLNTKESGKIQLQAKLKEKAENGHKKVRRSTVVEAKPSTSIQRVIGLPSNNMKKVPPTRPHSPKLGRITSTIQYQPPWRSSSKTDQSNNVVEKNKKTLTYSNMSLPKKNMHENTSPNKKTVSRSIMPLPNKNMVGENTSPNIQPSL